MSRLGSEMGLQGNIERADRHGVQGWVRDEADLPRPVSLVVEVDGQPVTRVLANTYREDLEKAGIGNGRHGFHLKLDGLVPTATHIVRLITEVGGADIPGSPIIVPPALRFDAEMQDALTRMLPDVESDAELTRRAAFLAQQVDRLLQLRAEQRSGRLDRTAHRHFRARWSGRGAASEPAVPRRALIIDDLVPDLMRDAGSQAVISHALSLQRLGFAVTFAPANMDGGESVPELEALGIACCCAPWCSSIEEVLRREAGSFDLIYLHRGSNVRYLPLLRHHQPRARVIYSVADLHHLRLARQAEVEQRPELRDASARVRTVELSAARFVDSVITHSSFEAALLQRDLPGLKVHVIPWSMPLQPTEVPWAGRTGCAFIGSYNHPPNLDAAWWLIQEIMPAVRAQDSRIECRLVGSNMPDSLRAAVSPGVKPLGTVENLAGLFSLVRLTVAPLAFGAGIKGKVLQSYAAGIPCACSQVAAEGLDLPPLLQETVASDAEGIARVILRLHNDEVFNAACSQAGLAYVAERLSEARLDALMREALGMRTPELAPAAPPADAPRPQPTLEPPHASPSTPLSPAKRAGGGKRRRA